MKSSFTTKKQDVSALLQHIIAVDSSKKRRPTRRRRKQEEITRARQIKAGLDHPTVTAIQKPPTQQGPLDLFEVQKKAMKTRAPNELILIEVKDPNASPLIAQAVVRIKCDKTTYTITEIISGTTREITGKETPYKEAPSQWHHFFGFRMEEKPTKNHQKKHELSHITTENLPKNWFFITRLQMEDLDACTEDDWEYILEIILEKAGRRTLVVPNNNRIPNTIKQHEKVHVIDEETFFHMRRVHTEKWMKQNIATSEKQEE